VSFFKNLLNKFTSSSATKLEDLISESDLSGIEEALISSDLGPELALDFTEYLRKSMRGIAGIGARKISRDDLPKLFSEFVLGDINGLNTKLELSKTQLNIITMVGVNGVGKTTSAAKIAYKYSQEGYKVLLVAADTFRAAAVEQLKSWAERAGVDIELAQEKDKPSAVVYRALARAGDYNLIIIDTAGRLQTKVDLMQELSKLTDVINKNAGEAKRETLLVLDASTGQNAISQAELFNASTTLTGIVLTKYDGTSKAGVVMALAHKFKLAVKLVGVGEGLQDLQEFKLDDFVVELCKME
jgi:fused signal recognition particle receptor